MFDATPPSDHGDNLSSFDLPDVRPRNPSDKDLQRAEGSGRIVLSYSDKGTRVMDVFQRAPIRIMFPRTAGGAVEEAVLINTAGGIAGGDRLETGVTALANSSIAITSQAAEKVYRALNEPARITTRLKAYEVAKLAWLPQETIVFNWGRLCRETEIELSSTAEVLALEWLVLGRTAHGEEMVGGHITDSWRVKKDDRLIWADSFRITDETFAHLHRKALLSNCRAVGTLIYSGPIFARRCSLPGVPMRRDIGWRAYHRSLCREGTLRLAGRLAQFSRAIQPRAGRRPFPGAEDVVLLKPVMERRRS